MKFKIAAYMLLVCFLFGCNHPIENKVVANEGQVVAKDGPVLEIKETTVELGIIPEENLDFIGPVIVSNKGSEDLKIINITGSCDCFKRYDGDKVIRPGKDGVIAVVFDKNKIETGQLSRTVTIETNDPVNQEAIVTFNFTVKRDPKSEAMLALRGEITGLRREVHLLRSDIRLLANALQGKADHSVKAPAKHPVDSKIYDVAVGKSAVLGSKDAPVTITEFIDLQCPYCVREYPKIQEVVRAYHGKVKVVFKHMPLSFHTKAKPVHAAVELALQEKGNDAFWKMHDMIMADPKKLEIADLRGYAKKLGLDMDKFDKTMADKGAIDKLLEVDRELAKKCSVRGTPTVMINGLKLSDRSIEAYKKRIDEILAKSAKPYKPKAVTKK